MIHRANKGRSFQFIFKITLHKDDEAVLQYIKRTLDMGQIHHFSTLVTFFVSKREHIAEILEIFSNYPLNTKKHLDFSD